LTLSRWARERYAIQERTAVSPDFSFASFVNGMPIFTSRSFHALVHLERAVLAPDLRRPRRHAALRGSRAFALAAALRASVQRMEGSLRAC
jgi:hypothetical protein